MSKPSGLLASMLLGLCLASVACTDDGSGESGAETETGDGDGDPTTGDGDGDPTTGDGDGDPTTGDGDGDPTTGDGDGDPTTGDGDGDDEPCAPLPADITPELEDLTLQAADGKQLAATFARPGSATCRPGLLLIHQYNLDRQQWAPQWSGAMDTFVDAGYVVLAIDLRGHGDSDPQDGALSSILTDPDQAPLDVSAGLDALLAHEAVDPERVAIVGTSVGANLAVVGMHQHPEVKAAVSLSPRTDPILALAAMPAQLELRELFCLAGELDAGGQAATCESLVPMAGPMSQASIYPGTAAHGVELVDDFPETIPAVIDWLDTAL